MLRQDAKLERDKMAGKVTIQIVKGLGEGKSFVYAQKESLVLGRKKNCAICVPAQTVSRYHCLIDIAPPKVMVRDFGSKNGTWLNGSVIGQRPVNMSPEEAQKSRFNEHEIHDGDTLQLGPDCELAFRIEIPIVCETCGAELEQEETVLSADGKHICACCLAAQKEAELAKNAEEQRQALREQSELVQIKIEASPDYVVVGCRKCSVCGAPIPDDPASPDICEECKKDPLQLLECLMNRAREGEPDAVELQGYELIESLGAGGMAQVWLVEETATGMRQALKLMLPKAASEQSKRNLFTRETDLLGQLDHPNIVRQYSSGGLGETFFILMEYCNGGTLSQQLKQHGRRMPVARATHIILQILDALAYAHSAAITVRAATGELLSVHGIVHRDLKPENILIQEIDGKAVYKIADFGLAKAFESAGLTGHTMTGRYCGTMLYMPRIQILDCRNCKPTVDLWAAMATYYEMMVGRPVREFSVYEDYAMTVLNRNPVPIRERDPNIPKKLADVIDKVLLKYDEECQSGLTAEELKMQIKEALS